MKKIYLPFAFSLFTALVTYGATLQITLRNDGVALSQIMVQSADTALSMKLNPGETMSLPLTEGYPLDIKLSPSKPKKSKALYSVTLQPTAFSAKGYLSVSETKLQYQTPQHEHLFSAPFIIKRKK